MVSLKEAVISQHTVLALGSQVRGQRPALVGFLWGFLWWHRRAQHWAGSYGGNGALVQ